MMHGWARSVAQFLFDCGICKTHSALQYHEERVCHCVLLSVCLQPNITAMIVSHDSTFLDATTTDIYHYENRRLRRYKGNLSEFVKVYSTI